MATYPTIITSPTFTSGSTVYYPADQTENYYVIGTNAFADIRDAVDASESGNSIEILAGTYNTPSARITNKAGVTFSVMNTAYGEATATGITASSFTNEGIFNLGDSTLTVGSFTNKATGTANLKSDAIFVDTTISNAGMTNIYAGSQVDSLFTGDGFINVIFDDAQAASFTFTDDTKVKGDSNIITIAGPTEAADTVIIAGATISGASITSSEKLIMTSGALAAVGEAGATFNQYLQIRGDNDDDISTINFAKATGTIALLNGATLKDSTVTSGTVALSKNIAAEERSVTFLGINYIDKLTNSNDSKSFQVIGSVVENVVVKASLETNSKVRFAAAGAKLTLDKAKLTVNNNYLVATAGGAIDATISDIVATNTNVTADGSFTVAGKSSIKTALNGTIDLLDGAELSNTAITGGKLAIAEGKTATFTGANSVGTISNAGSITVQGGMLTATSVGGAITIDADSFYTGDAPKAFKAIAGKVTSAAADITIQDGEGYSAVNLASNGLYLTTESQATLFVNSAYGISEGNAITADGHIFGYNAFNSLADALANIGADTTTITLTSNSTFDSPVTLTQEFTQNLTIGGGKTATLNFSGHNDLILKVAGGKTITLDAGTTLKTTGEDGYIVLAGVGGNSGAGSYAINGTVDSVSQVAFWGNAAVGTTGKIVSKYTAANTGMVLFQTAQAGANAKVTVTGAANQTTKAVQIDGSRIFLVSGKLDTTDTAVKADVLQFTQNLGNGFAADVCEKKDGEIVGKEGATFVLASNNTDWTLGSIEASDDVKIAGAFSFTNGSKVTVTDSIDLGSTVTMSLTDSTLTAKDINNAGALDLVRSGIVVSGTLTSTGSVLIHGGGDPKDISIGKLVGTIELKRDATTGTLWTKANIADSENGTVKTTNSVTFLNGTVINAQVENNGSITVDTNATLSGAKITNVNLGTANAPAYTSVTVNNGAILDGVTVTDGSFTAGTNAFTFKNATLDGAIVGNDTADGRGAITVDGGLTVEVDARVFANTLTLTTDSTVTISVGSDDAAPTDAVKVIDLAVPTTGPATKIDGIKVADNSGLILGFDKANNDYYVVKASEVSSNTIMVNSAWANDAFGKEVADGYFIGFNAFGSFADITQNDKGATPVYHEATNVVFEKGKSEFGSLGGKAYYYAKPTTTAPVVLKGSADGTVLSLNGNDKPRFYLMGDSVKYGTAADYKAGIADLPAQAFTIDSSLTIGAAFLYAGQGIDEQEAGTRYVSKANVTINGTVNAGMYVGPYSTAVVNGTLSSDYTTLSGSGWISLTVRPKSQVTVNGEANAAGYQLKEFLLKYIDGGSVFLNNTQAHFNAIELDGPDEGRILDAEAGVLTLNNSKLDIDYVNAGYVDDSKVFFKSQYANTANNTLTVTLKNGSTVSVGEGKTFNVLDSVIVNVGLAADDTGSNKLTAKAITNDGTINLNANSEIEMDVASSTAFGNSRSFTADGENAKVTLKNGAYFNNRYGASATFTNGASLTSFKGAFNRGQFEISNGASVTLTAGEDFTNFDGATITVINSTLDVQRLVNQTGAIININQGEGTFNKAKTNIFGRTRILNSGTFNANAASIEAGLISNSGSGTMELVNVALTGTTVAGKINMSGADTALNIGTKGEEPNTSNTGDMKSGEIVFVDDTTLAAGSGIYTAANMGGKLTVNEGVALGFGGDFEAANEALSNAGTITVNGKLSVGSILTVGSILMDGGDYLEVSGAVTGKSGEAPNEAFTGTITINDTAFTANKVLVQAGSGLLNTKITINNQVAVNGEKVTVGTGADAKVYTIALSDTSLALVEAQTKATLYVNKDYTPTSCDHVFGYNAFDNLGAAVANMDKTETVEKTTKIEVASSKDVTVTAGQDLTVSAVAINAKTGLENDPSVTIGFSGADKGLYLESGVEINGVDITTTAANGDAWTGTVYVNKAATAGKVTLAGDITAAGHIYFNGAADVTGDLATTGNESQILLRAGKAANGLVTIDGSAISSKWIVLISGETQITNSTITINALGFDNYASTDAAPVLISDNTKWTITEFVDLLNKTTDPEVPAVPAAFTFRNNSVINVAQGAALGSFITMNITGSTMTVTDGVNNAGKINVSGKVLKENTTEVVDNLKAAAITNSGLLSVTGDATVEATGTITNTGNEITEGALTKGISLNKANLVAGTFNNQGRIEAAAGAMITIANASTNTGTIELTGEGTKLIANQVTNTSGTIKVLNGATYNAGIDYGTLLVENANVDSTHVDANWGAFTVKGISTLNISAFTGVAALDGATLKDSTITRLNYEGYTATVSIAAEKSATFVGVNELNNGAAIMNAGTMNIGMIKKEEGKDDAFVSGTLTASAITNTGDLNIFALNAGPALTVTGDFANSGAVTLSATAADVMTVEGTFSNTGTITITAAPEMATFESKRIIAAAATDFGTITVSTDLAAQGYQVMVKNEGEGEGVYLFKNDKPVVRETIAVNLMWYDKTYGQDLIFGQDDKGQAIHYRFGVDAFQNANEVVNLTAETTEIKFASNLNSYGDLTLNYSTNVSVWSSDGLTKGGNIVLDNLTIAKTAEATSLIDVNLDAAGTSTSSVGSITILENTAITGAEVDFDGGYIVFGDEDAVAPTNPVLTISGSRINCDEKSKALTTTVYGDVVIKDASDVDFDDAATIYGNVTIGNDVANAAKSEVEFDRATKITGKLTLYGNSAIEADQGYLFQAGSAQIDGILKVDTEDKDSVTTTTNAKLGNITGSSNGLILTDVESDLSFHSTGFNGTLQIDVTGLEKAADDNKKKKFAVTKNAGAASAFTVSVVGDHVYTGAAEKPYKKYFEYSSDAGLTQIAGAANVYETNVSWAIGGDKAATQAAINAAVTDTKWTGADGATYYVDNVTLNGDIAYENKDTSLKSVYLGVNDGQNVILDGNFGAAVYGGKEYTATTGREGKNLGGDIYITVDGGTYSRVVVGGDRINVSSGRAVYYREKNIVVDNTPKTVLADITLTIEGGLFKNYVAAGVLYQGENLQGSVEVGSTNLVINGGTFVKDVYGGNYGNKKAASSCTYAEASNVTLTVGGAQTIDFQQALFVGSFGSGKLETTTLTLTGKSTSKDALKATEIWGGGSSDYYKETTTSRTYETAVSGARTLSFTGFDATVNCDKILGFSDVIVKSNDEELLDDDRIDTNATLSDKVSLSDVSNWTFEAGSTLAGAFKNDFAGDTLALGGIGNYFAATKLTSWTLFSDTTNFTGFDSFAKDKETGDYLVTFDGANAKFEEGAWVTENYKLSIDDTSKAMVLTLA